MYYQTRSFHMKRFFIFGLLIAFSGLLACNLQSDMRVMSESQTESKPSEQPPYDGKKTPVLVELFTSEGCSSCPPADRVLAQLEKDQPITNAEIVTLALHVDYWNGLGWKDEYSSAIFSRRQQLYSQALKLDSNYTPQMIVDGQKEFVGSDAGKAAKAISDALKTPKATIEIVPTEEKFKVKISNIPAHQNATVFLAVTEDNLASNIKGGENSGKKLEHTSVVRDLKSFGMLVAEQSNLELESALPTQPNWKRDNLKLIVFVQENASRKIIGVNRIALN